MFSSINRTRNLSSRKNDARSKAWRSKRLRAEWLESRRMLAGNVDIDFDDDTGVLSLMGDDSDNHILITAGESPGEITVQGASYDEDSGEMDTDTDINDAVSVVTYDNVQLIEVELEGGSDTFLILGEKGKLVLITADIDIDNDGGRNYNEFHYARIVGGVSIERVEGDAGNNLTIDGTEIVGKVEVDNFNDDADGEDDDDGFDGDSVTMIVNGSWLNDDIDVDNGEGKDIFTVDASSIDGDVSLENGEGETRTFFGKGDGTRPVVGGNIEIDNDEENDEFLLNRTDVWGTVDIDNGDGRTTTSIMSSNVGLNPTSEDSSFSIENGIGFDSFLMVDSEIFDGLEIENDGDGDGDDDDDDHDSLSGSETAIMSSTIGGDFELDTDDGYDIVNIMAGDGDKDDDKGDGVLFKGDVEIDLYDGGSRGSIFYAHIRGDFSLDADDGADRFTFEMTTVEEDVEIEFGDGRDRLELLNKTTFEGATSLFGDEDELVEDEEEDEDVDTLVRETGENAADIVFLVANTFNVNDFLDG